MRLRPLSPVVALLLFCVALNVVPRVAASVPFTLPGGSDTPAEAVRRKVCGAGEPERFEALEVLRRGSEAAVSWRVWCDGRELAGVAKVQRRWFSWRERYEGSVAVRTSAHGEILSPGDALAFMPGSHDGGELGPFSVVVGRVVGPEPVVAVEARFDGDRVEHAPADEAFALLSEGASVLCELRALGPDGRVVDRYDISRGYPGQCVGLSE